jgi:hypothetical protein
MARNQEQFLREKYKEKAVMMSEYCGYFVPPHTVTIMDTRGL